MANTGYKREMTGAELESMQKSQIHFKSPNNIIYPGLKLEEKDMKWWRDAKLGLFIHYGLYSVLGRGEWAKFNEKILDEEYEKLLDEFKAEKFDADEWAQIAKDAGMKYMVMVARHHDGFALWDSPGSYRNFTSMNSAAKRDFVKEYTDACRRMGLKVGIYYSPMDWRFPGYFKPKELIESALEMKKQCYAQVEELMSKYGKIDILWYDGGWLSHKGSDVGGAWLWEPVKLNQMVRKYNPKIVINPRSGWEGDFRCNEGNDEIRGSIVNFAWEKNFTLSRAWGWTPDEECMPFEEVMSHVINVVVRDGNVLINIPPRPDGSFPDSMVNVLMRLGKWMNENGESIYETRGGPFQPIDRVFGSCYKDNNVYIHIMDCEKFRDVMLSPIKQKVLSCSILNGEKLTFTQDDNGIKINIEPKHYKPIDLVVKMELDQPVQP